MYLKGMTKPLNYKLILPKYCSKCVVGLYNSFIQKIQTVVIENDKKCILRSVM